MTFHPLLRRQLKRQGLEDDAASSSLLPAWVALLGRVSRAYEEHDQERRLLEHSQELASQETEELYATLRQERDQLEERVIDRTAALRTSESRLQSLLSLSADWVWEQDANMRFTFLSEGVEKVAGIPVAHMIGRRREADEGFQAGGEEWSAYSSAVHERRPFRDFSYRFNNPAGELRYIRISGVPVMGDDGSFQGYRGIGQDITASTLAEQRIQELAHFDALTGLPNRSRFISDLEAALWRASQRQETLAIFFIDLDRFKTINDTLGHAAGDELLCAMASRIRGALRHEDLVARLGGDEFVVVVNGITDDNDLHQIAGKLLGSLSSPVCIQGAQFEISGSIGVARYPEDARDAPSLLKQADTAMYQAKGHGRNTVQFYTAEIAERAAREFEMESALRLAMVRDELFLHFQPKVSASDQRLTGLEALLRWRHPIRGMVSPAEFIPVAEERGLIIGIGRWVLGASLRQLAVWRSQGMPVPSVAVNLSARQFADPMLLPFIEQQLRDNGLQPQDLEVELTESVLMSEPERAAQLLRQLSSLGVHVTIDDFGTGYSSLSYLKRFPASCVKIDRSFINGLATDADDRAITQAVIAMAHSLGLRVVAEGVETREQLDALRQLSCDEVQGYLTGRPAAPQDLHARLALAYPGHTVPAEAAPALQAAA
ncbi:MAG: putative bifunctional diguanylate cyclase/phosphodiesterase [Rubrivivax sp.]|jgi:diguanylate cyclase (GGDEF)-like protein/PAS domain S-box-containing protein